MRSRWPLLLFTVLACLFMWRVVFAGQVFVPAHLLRYLAPWTADNRPPWNPLHYDSVGQFYPWRNFASQSMRGGVIPLWNPYEFSGTPFVANSQSAVFYPGNILFYLMAPARAAGISVILHLVLAAWFMLLFLRKLGVRDGAGIFGGIAFAFSTWQISWLHLPTFLTSSCWLPLVLLLTIRLFEKPCLKRTVGLGFAIGMTLLAGHLQIAFYVLLAAVLLAAYLALVGPLTNDQESTNDQKLTNDERRMTNDENPTPNAQCLTPSTPNAVVVGRSSLVVRRAGLFLAAILLGGMLAAPQILPSLELSKRSHRVAPPSAEGFKAYTNYAVGAGGLATLFMPNFYGNPSDADTPYFGESRGGIPFNYAEGALYIGIPTLLLAAIGLTQRGKQKRLNGYLGALALLAILMALGTAVDALLYFYLPGFGQSGSPGRSLVLWSFAISALAAVGLDRLITLGSTPEEKNALLKPEVIAIAGTAILGVLLIMLASTSLRPALAGAVSWAPQLTRLAGLFVLSSAVIVAAIFGKLPARWVVVLPTALLIADLFSTGINYNPTASENEVYPSTALTTFLQQNAGHDRIMPLNTRNFSFAGPNALMPPNGAMVYGLHDIQGYDSLFPGQYKAFMNRLAEPVATDASPLEVGNMVFAKNPASPLIPLMGVRWLLSQQELTLPGARSTNLDGIYLYELAGAPGRVSLEGNGAQPKVEWLEDSPTKVTLRVDTTSATNLTLADQFYPGWLATVDGTEVPISRANDIFRKVAVPAGSHTVAFSYQPAGFRTGLYLMLVVTAVGGFALITSLRSGERKTR